MRAYEYRAGVPAALDPQGGHYRFHRSQDAVWPPVARAYGGPSEPDTSRKAAALGLAAARLVLPVILLLILLGASYLYADAQLVVAAVPIRGLAISDLVLPGAWYCIHLTNRRYGPGYAFAQLAAALAIALAVILVNPGDIDTWVVTMPGLTSRTVLAFGFAFLAANFFAIVCFDAARGPRWWTAPLLASIPGSFVFSAIYYPAAFAGVVENWPLVAGTHLALFLAMSVLLLIPYWLLRPAMRPIDGRNGY